MSQPLGVAELTSAVGFFLALTSLLGTFFYIHLSNWFRDIIQLESKWKASRGQEESRLQKQFECRCELGRVLNHVPVLVSAIITIFMMVMLYMVYRMAASVSPRPAILNYYEPAFWVFLVTYLGLTLYFLVHGYSIAFRLRKEMIAKRG